MELNENKLSLKGVSNLPLPLEIDKEYDLTISNVVCSGASDRSNNDGTYNRTFSLKISELSEINIISEKQIIKSNKKSSQSKLLRYTIQQLAEKYNQDPEVYYNKIMSKLIDKYKQKLYE